MCYFEQYKMSCGDWKWGNFRQHCSKQYRTGETCGMKMVWETYQLEEKCKYCVKIDTKKGKVRKAQERIKRWRTEGKNRAASISTAEEYVECLEAEIRNLDSQRAVKKYGEVFRLTHDLAANTATLDQKLGRDRDRDTVQLLHATAKVPEAADTSSGSKDVDRLAPERVRSKLEDADPHGVNDIDLQEDRSDVSSIRSMDSIFSSLTVSSISSVGAGPEPGENLYLLLIRDDLRILYAQILDSTSTKDFEGALRYLLTTLASSLRKEAPGKKEKRVAKLLQWRVRNLAHRVAALMDTETGNLGSKASGTDMIDDGEISENEMNDSGDDDNNNETDMQALERFILESIAIKDFKASLVGLIPPAKVEQQEKEHQEIEQHEEVEVLDKFDEHVGMVEVVEERAPVVDRTWNKEVEISWKCSCGIVFEERIIEYKPGVAQKLADSIDTCASIDIEREAGSQFCSESSTSDSSATSDRSCRRTSKGMHSHVFETKDQVIGKHSTCREKKEFILLCQDRGNDTRLYHADVSKTPCDYSVYHVLHAQYYGRLKGFWRWLTLREISSVEFVKFSLYWATNVCIDHRDFGKLPPHPTEDYSFTANTDPPVPRSALRHFIENPSHAAKQPCHRPRIPKKVGGPLLMEKSLDLLEGYGIYIQERICWKKVFLIEAVFSTACMIFAVVWCVKHQGGIQDGFAIAGTGIAYATILLGASQAVAQNNWR